MDFDQFFDRATKGQKPFPYQKRLALGKTLPRLIHIPTGAGKTAIILIWLWRRLYHPDPHVRQSTPRRLVYCLPMRILVEQTRTVVADYLEQLELTGPNGVGVHVLMGGDTDDEWMLYPEVDAILIGTQDQLLSRALNRGFGLSRFRWPQSFGLIHSDCLWIHDEIQLFGAGLPTTAQLEAFRQGYRTYGPAHAIWMSATLQPEWLATVDHPAPSMETVFQLDEVDLAPDCPLVQRLHASKTLRRLVLKNGVKEKGYAREVAAAVLEHHRPGSTTLVILNTVDRVRAVHEALRGAPADLLLLHSRFRPAEREKLVGRLCAPLPEGGRIICSSQVVEAGVDLSALSLITELAPWASLVQRFGRCNRKGEFGAATVFWIDVADKQATPYETGDLQQSRGLLEGLEGKSVAPANLPPVTLAPVQGEVIRKRDLIDLFDTTSDLSGNDIDISRFIRVTNDYDVQLFWRSLSEKAPPPADLNKPDRRELCSVPVDKISDFLKETRNSAWVWDHLGNQWRLIRPVDLRPGLTILLRAEGGGYDRETGWSPASRVLVPVINPQTGEKEEATGDDPSTTAAWQSLRDHTDQVVAVLEAILTRLPVDEAGVLRRAARSHDFGKGHVVFQATLLAGASGERANTVWAKAPRNNRRHSRPHFRHELASALALLQAHPDLFLAAYLVAAHHGRIRLAIRSLDGEKAPDQPGKRFALGIWDGDPLPATDLGGGEQLPPTVLDLSPMEMGAATDGTPSWTERALALREEYGPFRLAYLEALLRAADSRASALHRKEGSP